MYALRISRELQNRLQRLANSTGHSTNYYAQIAIEAFLFEQEVQLKKQAANSNKLPKLSLEDVEKLLDLED